MSIENLIKKINEKDSFLQEKIKKEIQNEKDNILFLLETDLENFKQNQNLSFQKKIDNFKNSKETDLENFKQKKLLEIKRSILNSVFDEFFDNLKKINKEDYFNLIKKLLEKVSKNVIFTQKSKICIGNKLIIFDKSFENKIKSFIKENYHINEENIIFDKEIFFGIFYIDEKINIDLSYNSIISDVKNKYEIEISKILFQEE